jgi:hypothetical protein
MDLSTLEATVKALEDSLDSWGNWLTFFTALVVLGLFFEYWFEIKDIFKDPKSRWERLRHLFKIAGAVFVTLGVAGELCIEYKASKVETDLRTANGRITVALSNKAGGAKTSADSAADAAARAEGSAGKAEGSASSALVLARGARQEADSFEKDIVSAKKEAADAESHLADALRRASEAEEQAAQANLDLAKYKAPRTLTLDQQQRIIAKCRDFSGTPFDLDVSPNDEAVKLMNVIEGILISAGWSEQSSRTSLPLGLSTPKGKQAGIRTASGVVVWMAHSKVSQFSNAALTFGSALIAEGIAVSPGIDIDVVPNPNSSVIHIIIGSKP